MIERMMAPSEWRDRVETQTNASATQIKIEQNPAIKNTDGVVVDRWLQVFDQRFWVQQVSGFSERVKNIGKVPNFNDGYYARANLFLEQAELLGNINGREEKILKDVLVDSAVSELLNIYQLRQDDIVDTKKTKKEFELAILHRLLAEKIDSDLNESTIESILLDGNFSIELWLANNRIESAASMLKTAQIPVSLASTYLDLVGRDEEKPFFANQTAPDAAFNGPNLIGKKLQTDERMKKSVEAVQVRVLLSRLPRETGDSILEELSDRKK
jgi:hypothetical protein